MKNVLFVRSSPYEDNINNYNVQGIGIAKAFCDLGINCDYLTFTREYDGTIEIYRNKDCVARVLYKKWKRFFRTGVCKEVLKTEFLNKYDYIICREYNQIMTYYISKMHNNVYMYTGPYWNMFMLPFMSPLYDFLIVKKLKLYVKKIFVKSELAANFLKKKGIEDTVDIGVGLDIKVFENCIIQKNTQELVDFMKSSESILYVGTLNDNKNLPFILKLFSFMLEKHEKLKLVLIGKSEQTLLGKMLHKSNESYYKEIYDKLPEKVQKNIIHFERIENSQLQFIYPCAKAFILPSKKEIFGMVLLEAMYFGAPVITTYNGGSSSLIKNKNTGQIIYNMEIKEWAKAIEKYLNDEQYTNKIKKQAKKLIIDNYTWESIVKKMLNEIE